MSRWLTVSANKLSSLCRYPFSHLSLYLLIDTPITHWLQVHSVLHNFVVVYWTSKEGNRRVKRNLYHHWTKRTIYSTSLALGYRWHILIPKFSTCDFFYQQKGELLPPKLSWFNTWDGFDEPRQSGPTRNRSF